MSLLALAVGSIGLWLPPAIGASVLGATWTVAAPLLPITGTEYAALAWVSVMYTALRSQGRSHALLKTRIFHAGISLTLAVGAAAVWREAVWVAVALAVAAIVSAVLIATSLWWVDGRRAGALRDAGYRYPGHPTDFD
jgi:hypothetical protein